MSYFELSLLFHRNTTLYLILLLVSSVTAQSNESSYVDDFNKLLEELNSGYANLSYTIKDKKFDFTECTRQTRLKLAKAKSKNEALQIFQNYLKKFDDEHLVLQKFSPKSHLTSQTSHQDETSSVLEKLGFRKEVNEFYIKYDSISNAEPLQINGNPFPMAIIKEKNNKLGIIRIEFFSHEFYWETAERIWNNYKDEERGICDFDCQDKFLFEIELELIDRFKQCINLFDLIDVDGLVLDISNNGGGTEIAYAFANIISEEHLKNPPFYITSHAHWMKNIKDDLKLIEHDLVNSEPSSEIYEELKSLEEKALVLLDSLNVNRHPNNRINKLIKHEYRDNFSKTLLEYSKLTNLKSKQILNTARFQPYEKVVFDKPIYIVQNENTASAAEGFSSLLQFNDSATINGEKSYGVGCGYTNGGIKVELQSINSLVKIPDCVRLRKDGENEKQGVIPDISVLLEGKNSYEQGQLIVNAILNDL